MNTLFFSVSFLILLVIGFIISLYDHLPNVLGYPAVIRSFSFLKKKSYNQSSILIEGYLTFQLDTD